MLKLGLLRLAAHLQTIARGLVSVLAASGAVARSCDVLRSVAQSDRVPFDRRDESSLLLYAPCVGSIMGRPAFESLACRCFARLSRVHRS